MGFSDPRLSKGDTLLSFLLPVYGEKRQTFTERLLMGKVVSVDRLKLTLVNQIHCPCLIIHNFNILPSFGVLSLIHSLWSLSGSVKFIFFSSIFSLMAGGLVLACANYILANVACSQL